MALTAAHLNAGVILVVTVYIIIIFLFPLFPQLQSPVPNKPYGFRGREAPRKKHSWLVRQVGSFTV